MDVSVYSYSHGDPQLLDKIVNEFLSQGKFDKLRKECMADADTKPAYQNLQQRVENTTSQFLKKQVWKPELNKNQLRDSLRKNILESGFLDSGINRIVDQVVNQNVLANVFLPEVEEVYYNYLSIPRPAEKVEKKCIPALLDLKTNPPTDVETAANSLQNEKGANNRTDEMSGGSQVENLDDILKEQELSEKDSSKEISDTNLSEVIDLDGSLDDKMSDEVFESKPEVKLEEEDITVEMKDAFVTEDSSAHFKPIDEKVEFPEEISQEPFSPEGVSKMEFEDFDTNNAADSDASIPLEINEKSMSDSGDSDDSIMNKMSPISQGKSTPDLTLFKEDWKNEKSPLTFVGRIPKIKRDDSESSKSSKTKEDPQKKLDTKSVYSSDESDSSKHSLSKSDSDEKKSNKKSDVKKEESSSKSQRDEKRHGSDKSRRRDDHHRSSDKRDRSRDRRPRDDRSRSRRDEKDKGDSHTKDRKRDRSHEKSSSSNDKKSSSSHSRDKSSSSYYRSDGRDRNHRRDDSKYRDKDKDKDRNRHGKRSKDRRDDDKKKKEEEKRKKSKNVDDHSKERNKREDRRSTDRDSNEREKDRSASGNRLQTDDNKRREKEQKGNEKRDTEQKEESDKKDQGKETEGGGSDERVTHHSDNKRSEIEQKEEGKPNSEMLMDSKVLEASHSEEDGKILLKISQLKSTACVKEEPVTRQTLLEKATEREVEVSLVEDEEQDCKIDQSEKCFEVLEVDEDLEVRCEEPRAKAHTENSVHLNLKQLLQTGAARKFYFPPVRDDFYKKFNSTGFRYFEEWEMKKEDCEVDFKEHVNEATDDLSLLSDDGSEWDVLEDGTDFREMNKKIIDNMKTGISNFEGSLILDPVDCEFYVRSKEKLGAQNTNFKTECVEVKSKEMEVMTQRLDAILQENLEEKLNGDLLQSKAKESRKAIPPDPADADMDGLVEEKNKENRDRKFKRSKFSRRRKTGLKPKQIEVPIKSLSNLKVGITASQRNVSLVLKPVVDLDAEPVNIAKLSNDNDCEKFCAEKNSEVNETDHANIEMTNSNKVDEVIESRPGSTDVSSKQSLLPVEISESSALQDETVEAAETKDGDSVSLEVPQSTDSNKNLSPGSVVKFSVFATKVLPSPAFVEEQTAPNDELIKNVSNDFEENPQSDEKQMAELTSQPSETSPNTDKLPLGNKSLPASIEITNKLELGEFSLLTPSDLREAVEIDEKSPGDPSEIELAEMMVSKGLSAEDSSVNLSCSNISTSQECELTLEEKPKSCSIVVEGENVSLEDKEKDDSLETKPNTLLEVNTEAAEEPVSDSTLTITDEGDSVSGRKIATSPEDGFASASNCSHNSEMEVTLICQKTTLQDTPISSYEDFHGKLVETPRSSSSDSLAKVDEDEKSRDVFVKPSTNLVETPNRCSPLPHVAPRMDLEAKIRLFQMQSLRRAKPTDCGSKSASKRKTGKRNKDDKTYERAKSVDAIEDSKPEHKDFVQAGTSGAQIRARRATADEIRVGETSCSEIGETKKTAKRKLSGDPQPPEKRRKSKEAKEEVSVTPDVATARRTNRAASTESSASSASESQKGKKGMRVGLPKPKRKSQAAGIGETPAEVKSSAGQRFNMPLSPESDDSIINNTTVAVKPNETPAKKPRRSTRTAPVTDVKAVKNAAGSRAKKQTYDSDDLYKPRTFSTGSRRRGRSSQLGTSASESPGTPKI